MWVKGAMVVAKALSNKKLRNILLSAILVVPMLVIVLMSIPTVIFTMPKTVFMEDKQQEEYLQAYIDMLVEYKDEVHKNVRAKRQEFINKDVTVEKTLINYPSLSLLVAYDNVINKDYYMKDETPPKVKKEEAFKFLNSVMSYGMEGKNFVAKVKSPSEVSKYFKNEDDKMMFELVYETMLKTDLDNTVPEVEFVDFEYTEGGIKLPYLSQLDKRWADKPYGDSTVGKAGCAIASTCMVINGLLPEAQIYPDELAKWSYQNGHYVSNVGTAWSFFGAVAQKYNLNLKTLSRNNPQSILDELSRGNPIVVSMSPGHFTRGGHMIVLRGIDKDGKILVSDPASRKRTDMSWDFSIILSESSVLSPSCFWAFSK